MLYSAIRPNGKLFFKKNLRKFKIMFLLTLFFFVYLVRKFLLNVNNAFFK